MHNKIGRYLKGVHPQIRESRNILVLAFVKHYGDLINYGMLSVLFYS